VNTGCEVLAIRDTVETVEMDGDYFAGALLRNDTQSEPKPKNPKPFPSAKPVEILLKSIPCTPQDPNGSPAST
jgi:hypothetical protein